VDVDRGQLVGRRLKDIAIVMDLHELTPVGGRAPGRRDGRRLERLAEVCENLPDRPWLWCKTPAMVLAEVWATILAYNLIRTTVAGAAALHDKQPRQISFTAACQYILSTWMMLSASRTPAATLRELRLRLLEQIASCDVANRPGRFEPRVIKRRKHRYPLMKQPRADLRRGIATSTA
jgi:hypothetical protein